MSGDGDKSTSRHVQSGCLVMLFSLALSTAVMVAVAVMVLKLMGVL